MRARLRARARARASVWAGARARARARIRVRARARARVRVGEPPRCDRGDGRLSRVGLGEVVDEEQVLLDRARHLG